MKISTSFKKIPSFIFLVVALIVSTILFLNYWIESNDVLYFDRTYKIILIVALTVETIIASILYFSKRRNWKVENIYLLLAIITGIFYMALIPVGLVPDEKSHFLRAYEIADFHLVSDKNEDGLGGRVYPKELKEVIADTTEFTYQDVFKNRNTKTSNEKEFLIFSNTSLYSFVCYIPQSIGIFLAKTVHLAPLEIAYTGRIFNFACFLIIMYFSLKFIPCYKNTFMMIALLPITMQEAVSLSPDALTIATSFALISFVLYMKNKKKGQMNKKELIIMSILATILSMCKIVYLPLCLLLFLIPEERFKSKKDKYVKICLLAAFVILINVFWLGLASSYLVEFQPGVNSKEQVKFILTNPFQYIQIIASTIIEKSDFYLFGFLGRSLEWFNLNLPYLFPLITLVLLVLTIKKDKEKEILLEKKDKMITIFIFCATILLIFTSLYVQWTSAYNKVIEGVQGRYFIPCFLLVPMLIASVDKIKKSKMKGEEWFIENLLMFLTVQNVVALIIVFTAHI